MTFERCAWSAEAEAGLSETFGHDRDAIIAGVGAGVLECWKVNGGQAWMVTRIDGSDLVVCCLQGSGLDAIAPVMYRIAQRNNLRAMRFFTRRPALVRLLKRQGLDFEPQETVYRCEVRPHE